MKKWDLTDLEAELKKRRAKGIIRDFCASEMELDRKEFYLIQDLKKKSALDQARRVDATHFHGRVFVAKDNNRLGSADRPLLAFQELGPQLDQLIAAARLSDEENWLIPEPNGRGASAANLWPEMKENFADAAQTVLNQMNEGIRDTAGIFNSAEIFLNKIKTQRLASNGFHSSSEVSRIYSEVCFSADHPTRRESEEFLIVDWFAHPSQVDLKAMCRDSFEFAASSLNTERPQSGSYEVLLPADVLNTVLNDSVHQFESARQYYRLPFLEKGADFIKNFKGDSFKLYRDPSLPYGFNSLGEDSFGRKQDRLLLVDSNKVQQHLTNSRYSQYLKVPETSTEGAVVIEAKGHPLDQLRKSAPRVLEILQFSGLFSDPMTMTFSSEIRLARLWDNETGKVRYIKGGNFSGNFAENFSRVKWSSEKRQVNYVVYSDQTISYSGPAYALISGVAISS